MRVAVPEACHLDFVTLQTLFLLSLVSGWKGRIGKTDRYKFYYSYDNSNIRKPQ
jgi:hypothetical protein